MNAAVTGIGVAALLVAGFLGSSAEKLAAAEDIRAIKRWPGTIEATKLNVRSGPGQEYDTIESLNLGDEVIVVDQVGAWVRLEREGEGWVSRRFVRLPENFMQPLFGDGENAFIDWASATGQFREISVEANGRIAVILMAELYTDPTAAREAGEAAACAYGEHVAAASPVSVVIWAEQGPAAGIFGEVSCPE